MRTEDLTPIQRGALRANELLFPGREPTEPYHSRGGVFDPSGYTMLLANAVAYCLPAPRVYRDRETPIEWIEEVREAIGAAGSGSLTEGER